jgi:hypothetical protein
VGVGDHGDSKHRAIIGGMGVARLSNIVLWGST